jgi:CheY-like chemotaxis protein
MDGFTFLDRLRRLDQGRTIPVMIWSVMDLTAEDHARVAASARSVVRKDQGHAQELVAELEPFLTAASAESEPRSAGQALVKG